MDSAVATQLPLGVQLKDEATFESFLAGPNTELLASLQRVAQGRLNGIIYLHGTAGSGRTHLLQALCHASSAQGRRAAYLPLKEFSVQESQVLEGMANLPLLCLDDIDAVSAETDWALLLMRLCDVSRQNGPTLVVTAPQAPVALQAAVADLRTRLSWGLVFALQPLTDEERLGALQLRARARGLDIPAEVGRFLMQRKTRSLPALMEMLDTLDQASLAASRRLTVPFVKSVLKL